VRITIVIGPYNPIPTVLGGAVERVHQTLSQEFVRRGHEVTIVSRQYGDFPEQEMIAGVRYLRVPSYDAPTSKILYRVYDLIYSRRVAKMLPAADITVTNSVFLPVVLPAERSGNIYVHAARFPKRQMGFYRRASRIQTVSSVVAAAIVAQTPSMRDRVISIPNPISNTFADAVEMEAPVRDKTVLFVGRIAREKGVDLLIQAFSRLAAGPLAGYRLRVVGPHEIRQQGDGQEYLDELHALAAPVADRVDFTGPVFDQERLREIYLGADIFVYPSVAEQGETFGLAPLEAMAAGCRVVVSGLECFREFVVPGENAVVFDHREDPVGELANSLSAVVNADPSELRAAGRATARGYTATAIAELYLADFNKVLAKADGQIR